MPGIMPKDEAPINFGNSPPQNELFLSFVVQGNKLFYVQLPIRMIHVIR